MAGTSAFYNAGLVSLLDGTVPLTSGEDLRAVLLLSSYSFSASSDFLNDIAASEALCTPTSGSRVALTSEALAANTAATPDAVEFDAADVTFTAVDTAQTVGGVAIYSEGGASDASRNLLCYIAITNTSTNGGNITVSWAATGGATAGGILNIPVS